MDIFKLVIILALIGGMFSFLDMIGMFWSKLVMFYVINFGRIEELTEDEVSGFIDWTKLGKKYNFDPIKDLVAINRQERNIKILKNGKRLV